MSEVLANRVLTLAERLRERMEKVERIVYEGEPGPGLQFIPGPSPDLVEQAKVIRRDLAANNFESKALDEWIHDPGEDVTPRLIDELRGISLKIRS